MPTLGFIGAGNMSSAMIARLIRSGFAAPADIWIVDIDAEKVAALSRTLGVQAARNAKELIAKADLAVLAVKPQHLPSLLKDIAPVANDAALVSIAAGVSSESLAAQLPAGARFVRVMPNTPAMVGEGMAAISTTHTLTAEEYAFVHSLFEALGRAVLIEERLFDAVTGLSGSGPAYAFLVVEAMADAGVLLGLPRQTAIEMAAQTVLGAARMVLETGTHPAALRDSVCSPGGTTIEGVFALEETGVRAGIMQAVLASAEKSKALSERAKEQQR